MFESTRWGALTVGVERGALSVLSNVVGSAAGSVVGRGDGGTQSSFLDGVGRVSPDAPGRQSADCTVSRHFAAAPHRGLSLPTAAEAATDSAWDPRVFLTLETRMEHGYQKWCAAEAAEVPGRAG